MGVEAIHPEYDAFIDTWTKLRDVYEGEEAIKEGRIAYLPPLSGHVKADFEGVRIATERTIELTTAYDRYLQRAWFYEAFSRTVEAFVGLIMRKSTFLEGVEPLEEFLGDVTGTSVPFDVMARDVIIEALITSRYAILSDFSRLPDRVPTRAEAEFMGLKPTIRLYVAEDVKNWRFSRIGSEHVLVLLVLCEMVEEEGGDEFETVIVEKRRVLELVDGQYQQRIFRWEDGDDKGSAGKFVQEGEVIVPKIDSRPLDRIPVVLSSVDIERPPLRGLANMSLAHYRNVADYEHGLLLLGNPTPVVIGHTFAEGEQVPLGASEAMVLDGGADAKYLEFEGEGMGALREAMIDKERLMALLGSRMLREDPKGVEAAETALLHRHGEGATLAAIADKVSRHLQQILKLTARWLQEDDEGIRVELNRDFLPRGISPDELSKIVEAWQSGALTENEMFWNLKRGEKIPGDKTFEQHREELESESLAEPVAVQDDEDD